MAGRTGGDWDVPRRSLERALKVVFNARGGYSQTPSPGQAMNSWVDGELSGQTPRVSAQHAEARRAWLDVPSSMPRTATLPLALILVACTAPADTTTSGAAKPTDVQPSDAQPSEGWQRGTVTVGPDGLFAIHADDDSVTVCAFDLPAELQQKDLALRFRGELIPPKPNERRWCTEAKDLQVERASP